MSGVGERVSVLLTRIPSDLQAVEDALLPTFLGMPGIDLRLIPSLVDVHDTSSELLSLRRLQRRVVLIGAVDRSTAADQLSRLQIDVVLESLDQPTSHAWPKPSWLYIDIAAALETIVASPERFWRRVTESVDAIDRRMATSILPVIPAASPTKLPVIASPPRPTQPPPATMQKRAADHDGRLAELMQQLDGFE